MPFFIALSMHAFGRGWMLHAQLFFYYPALLCLSNYYNKHSTLIDSFGRGWVLHTFIYTYISFRNLFYNPSCLSQSTLLEKCHSTTDSFLKALSSLYFSVVSFIILHCPINPCFWEGVDVACQAFLLSSCIALSFHTTKKNTLLTPLIGDRIL